MKRPPVVVGPPGTQPGTPRYQVFEKPAPTALPGGLTPGKQPVPDNILGATQFASLDPAIPLLLLPVRIETRYVLDTDPQELRIRVYPDPVHIDAEHASSTGVERTLAVDFWTRWHHARSDQARESLWRSFAGRTGARAGHLARLFEPLVDKDGGLSFPKTPPGPEGSAARPVLLPQRWLALGYAGGERIFLESSAPVSQTLRTGADPAAATSAIAGGDLAIDDGLAWMIDYGRALQAGMAITVPLTGTAATARDRVDVLLVVGVHDAAAPVAAAELLRLIDVHARTTGCAFVPQGTPTNNTETAQSGWMPGHLDEPPTAARAIGIPKDPKGPAGIAAEDNAARFAWALGLADAAPLRRLAHGDEFEAAASQHMRVAAFEAVIGTFLRQLLDLGAANALAPDTLTAIRQWFIDRVTGGAPVPCLRIGAQPYGVLPVRRSSAAPDLSATGGQVERVVQLLLDVWRLSASGVPSLDPDQTDVAGAGDPNTDIASILAAEPHPARILLRVFEEYVEGSTPFSPQPLYAEMLAMTDPGAPGNNEGITIAGALFQLQTNSRYPDGFASIDDQIDVWNAVIEALPIVTTGEVLQQGLGFVDSVMSVLEGYERRQRPLRWIGLDQYKGVLGEEATRLIAGLLWFDTGEWGQAGLIQASNPAPGTSARDYLLDFKARVESRTLFGALPATPLSMTLDPKPLLFQLLQSTLPQAPNLAETNQRLAAALGALAAIEPATLEWLLRETLGLGAHRLDAWATSLAVERLERLRAARPSGVHVGGFGWVVNLRPRRSRRPSSGFIHAPSMAHATTAALLRAGWQAHGTDDPASPVAVDLRSDRVRTAAWLLEGVRQGQVLGDLLGYRFERRLHDLFADDQIRPVRQLVLAASGKPDASLDKPVDGIELLQLSRAGRLGTVTAPVTQALADLDAAFDAVNDVTLFESVHQLAGGNLARATAMLDAMALGTIAPPELRSVRTPRAALSVAHRVVVLLDPDAAPATGWSAGMRDRIVPELETWVASLLPPPGEVGFTVVADGSASPIALSLADLAMSALDAIFLVGNDPDVATAPIRTLVAAAAGFTPAAINGGDPAGRSASFADFVVLATELRRLVETLRPAEPRDLRPPSQAGEDDSDPSSAIAAADALLAETRRFASKLATAVAISATDASHLVGVFAYLGISTGAAPSDASSLAALLTQVGRRMALVDGISVDGADPRPGREAQIAALLGAHVPLLPRFVLAGHADGPVVDVGTGTVGELEVDDWLDAMGRVRPDVGRLTTIGMLSELLGAGGLSLAAGQYPADDGGGWAATSLPSGAGRLSVVAATPRGILPRPGQTVSGFVVDRWSEPIPSTEQTTGVAFHYDAPTNRPPQSWLLATTPDGERWNLDLVVDTLLETLEWARLRAAGPEDLVDYGRAIPTSFTPGRLSFWKEP